MTDDPIEDRLARVRRRIVAACDRAGRDPDEVVLVAVTKTHPPERIRAVVEAGVGDLGENRVEELEAKLTVADLPSSIRWHFVGQLQSRKANALVGRGVLIHSVDRRSLVERLQRLAEREGLTQPLLVQVNVGDDPAKGGCGLDEVDDLVAYAHGHQNLAVRGVMTIPPLPPPDTDPQTAARPHFARLREVRDRLRDRWPDVTELSMGMSADLEAAVEEGATLVRIGTALLGQRGPAPWAPSETGDRPT